MLTFFGVLVIMGAIILETESRLALAEFGLLDGLVIALASWRLTRLVGKDSTTKFFREQFYELRKTTRGQVLEVPEGGIRRTLLEIVLSPWHFGLGATALVTFCYLLTQYALYPIYILALAGILALIEIGTNSLASGRTEE